MNCLFIAKSVYFDFSLDYVACYAWDYPIHRLSSATFKASDLLFTASF